MTNFRTRYDFFGSIVITIVIMLGSIWVSCSKEEINPRLASITEIVSSSPQEALDSLKAIDKDCLSESDRYYYDFLTVKASDKAFIRHQSDSLIKEITYFYSTINDSKLYPEILYYNGRVYQDLGDSPKSISFYYKALEVIPYSEVNLPLLGNIYTQMSTLFDQLRLYDNAVNYLEKSIDIDIKTKDSLNLIYDLETMGHLNIRLKQYDEANRYLQEALKLAKDQPGNRERNIYIYLAGMYLEKERNDSALTYIRLLPETLKTNARYTALANASKIYHRSGILDTAYQYAYELANSTSPNRRIGFNVLLSPEIRKILPVDSIIKFSNDYIEAVEEYLNQNESEEVSIKNSIYNYNIHLQEKENAEKRNHQLLIWLGMTILTALVIITFFIYRQNIYQKKIIKLHTSLENAKKLKELLREKGIIIDEQTYEGINLYPILPNDPIINLESNQNGEKTPSDLRKELRDTLVSISKNTRPVPVELLASAPYKKIKQWLREKKGIDDNNPLWEELEQTVTIFYPDFYSNLMLLSNGKMTKIEFNVALLIKCEFPITEISQLLNKTLSTIGSRRETLGYKIFDEKISVKIVDDLIRAL